MMWRCRCGAAAWLMLVAAAPLPAQRVRLPGQPRPAAQPAAQLMTELGRLREATALESAGDLAGAEAIAREVLTANPGSLSALLTLERLLTLQGRVVEMVEPAERLLATDPVSVVAHQMRLRIFSRLNDVPRLEAAVAAWVRATPELETPYREAAVVWRDRGEGPRAVAILEQGRKRIDRTDALALELGDAWIAAGNTARAAAEWSRAVGLEGRGFLLVQRRLQNLPDGGAAVIPQLVERLAQPTVSFGRVKAAALLAIDAGLAPAAQRLTRQLATDASGEEREALLVELGRRADGAGLHSLALWAYSELLTGTRDAGATLAIRTRIAELALLAGDTARAAAAYQSLEAAAAPGSPQRRQAMALRIQLVVRERDLARAAAELDVFRQENPQAAELDVTASAVAEGYLDAGDLAAAERVLTGVTGPRAGQLRGRVHLRKGEIERAREELLGAAPLLRGREATEVIGLAALLMRVTPRGGELVARVIAAPDAERTQHITEAATAARTLPASERAAVLDFLAAAAERDQLLEDAGALRREIVETLPRTLEAAGALLALARQELEKDATEEARVLLEKLILEYPRSALTPQARAELQRLQARADGQTR